MRTKKNFLFFVIGAQLCVIACIAFYLLEASPEVDTLQETTAFLEMPSQEAVTNRSVNIPFKHIVRGKGRVVPSTHYVHITSAHPGVIRNIFVQPGQLVEEGEVLFSLDDTDLQHQLSEKKAEYQTAVSQLHLVEGGTALAQLRVKEKEIDYIQQKMDAQDTEHQLYDQLYEQKVVSLAERKEKEQHTKLCAMELDKVRAEYMAMKEGPSSLEKQVQASLVAEKESKYASTLSKIQRCKISSPIEGRVLAVNKHRGEFTGPHEKATVVLGSDSPLHLEVMVDEETAWRITPQSSLRAIAFHQSNPNMHFVLEYVGLSPILEGKGADTKQLCLKFSFEKNKAPVYLEQKLDVIIEANSPEDTAFLDYQFNQLRF